MVDWSTCPPQAGPARDKWILDAVLAGESEAPLAEIEVSANGHTGRFTVLADGLMLGGVRINVSAYLQQQIADALGAMLLTPRLADLVWQARSVDLPPMPRQITSSTAAMIEQSDKISAAIPPGSQGIKNTIGKHWCLVKSIFSDSAMAAHKAANYGWHFQGSNFQGIKGEPTVSLPGVRVIQGVGTVHDYSHTDYSQICQLVMRACIIDGQESDLANVLQDPELAPLVSHEGPLPGWRQPGVPSALTDGYGGPEGVWTGYTTPGGGSEGAAPAASSKGKKIAAAVAFAAGLFVLSKLVT